MPKTQSMSSADAAWRHMDQPTNLMVVTSALWFDETPDWGRVREIIRTRFVEPFSRFRQLSVEGRSPLSRPHWEDDPNFDLDLHIHRVALPPPGDKAALQTLVADVMAAPLDPSKPLWHIHFVDNYGDGAAMVFRIHHCIADGIALARVLLSLTDDAPDAGIAPRAEPRHGLSRAVPRRAADALSTARDVAGAVAHEAVEVARHPSELLDLAATARDDAGALAKALLASSDPKSPLKGELGVAQKVAWSTPIPLDEVKEKCHETGTTVNDLVLTAIAGALRRYLSSRHWELDELTAFIPFNLRPLDQPLPADLGNRFGLVFLHLPIGIEDDRERLEEIHRRMDEIKHSPEGAVGYGLLEAIGHTPVQIEQRLIKLFSAKGTAVITNVPGPPEPVYLAGTPVRGVLIWGPRSGSVSMSVGIFSYTGEITAGFMVDAGLIPEPEEIAASFERELEALLS